MTEQAGRPRWWAVGERRIDGRGSHWPILDPDGSEAWLVDDEELACFVANTANHESALEARLAVAEAKAALADEARELILTTGILPDLSAEAANWIDRYDSLT